MSDFQVRVGGDFQEILRGFQQLEARAQQSGQRVGQSLNQGVQDFSRNSLAALNQELTKLQQRQTKVSVDSSEFVQTGLRIREVQGQIDSVERRKILIGADPSSIIALQTRLGGLREELDRTKIGSQRFQELQAEVRKTEIELNKATGAGGGFTERMRQLGPALAAVGLAGVGVTRALGSVISTAAQFDQEVRKAAAIEGSGQFNALRGAIEGVASAAAGTPTQVAELATALSRAGFSAEETEAALGGIVTGAEATAVSFEDMGSIVSNVLRSFGLDASKTNDVVDTLTNTANSSNQSVLDLGEAFKVAAPVARNLGVGVDDLSATLALLANNGIRGSEAGTALRTGLTRLQIAAGGSNEELLGLTRGSELLANAMRQLGADVLDTNGNLKPMDEVILSLRENINQFDTTKRAEITKALFGDEQASKFLALLNSSETDIRSLFGTIRDSGGVADETRKQMQGFSFSFEQLKGNVENVTNAIGGAFLAVLKPMVDGLNLTLSAAQALPAPIRNLAAALAAAGIAAGGAAAAVAVFKTALAGVTVQGTIAAITTLVTALKVQLAGAATVAVVSMQGLVGALKGLSTVTVAQAVGPIVTALKVQLAGAAATATTAFTALATAIKSGALIASMKAFGVAAAGAAVAMAPLALAIGGVIALVKTWEFVLGGAAKASDEFAKSQDAVSVALAKLGADLDETASKAREANAGFLGLGEVFRNAREGWTLMRLVDETNKLEAGFDQVFNSAVKFTNELKNSSEVTEEQRKKAQEYIKQLQAISEAYRAQAERAKNLAVEEARLGNQDVAKYYESQSRSLVSNANALDNLRAGFERQIGIQSSVTAGTEANTAATDTNKEAQENLKAALNARAEAEAELNRLLAERPVRDLDAQIAVGQQLVGLSKALAEQEQSRFAVTKAGLEFELKAAQERGASEAELGRLKQGIQELDRQAAEARYKALQQQQELERQMLDLAQQKARVEADLSANEARVELLKAEAELSKATTAEEQAAAQAQVALQQQIVGIRQEQKDILAQTQPLEQQSLKAQQETAVNTEKTKLAQAGFKLEADGSVTATANLAAESAKAKKETEALRDVQQQIGEIISETTVRQATQQVAVGEKLLGLARALATEEQSRFDLVRSNLEYELKKAEERGASESEIAGIKQQIQKTDRAAAEARYAALLQQQQIEAKMLEIAQRKQVLEANVEVRKQQIALLEAEQKLREALLTGDQGAIRLAGEQLELQRLRVGLAGEQLNVLGQTQPIERQILASQQQAAINAERAQAAQNGYRLAAATSAVNLNNLATSAGRFSGLLATGAANQQRLQGYMSITAGDAVGVAKAVGDMQTDLRGSTGSASSIASAFVTTGDRAPAAAQGARDFAAWLSQAKVFGEQIARLPIAQQMATVASETARAAAAARVFYDWLERASRLPGSRWTGGPVEAGESYKVNELGQEALLSGGRLSLINAAPNSLWRAPANGTVIPAGITARLQEQGAIAGRGGSASALPLAGGGTNAQLAIEVGKLRQEVGELARKQWNVNITTKTGPTGSQVLKQMLR
jgi:TP901 family phage tail tape measure protein